MAKQSNKIHYCRDCRFARPAPREFQWICGKDGSINHSPMCGLFKQR